MPSYTKDYYSILALPHTPTDLSSASLRRAYKLALLASHPDKQYSSTNTSQHSVDAVKEAYAVLSDPIRRGEYDLWLRGHPEVLAQGIGGEMGRAAVYEEMVVGLEVLDLSDFDVLDPGFKFSSSTTTPSSNTTSTSTTAAESMDLDEREEDIEVERNGQMEWTRACRCGDEKGFVILEEELEDAEGRGGRGGFGGVWGV